MNRRSFLKQSLTVSTGLLVASRLPAPKPAEASTENSKWRTFEVTTKVEVLEPKGASKTWLPVPLLTDTDYFKRLGDDWTGNAVNMGNFRNGNYGAGIVYAEWKDGEKAPVLQLTSRFMTRDRQIDFKKPKAVKEDAEVLKYYLQPSTFIPTDGIVADTARVATLGAKRDVDKAKAIYEWIVDNTFRDPKVKGCGIGDIRAMLESRNLGGKCADLNALYVGMARASGLPARDVYGVRVANSADFKSLGKAGDITKAQHCRAEVYLNNYGWVPVDPADVRKVVLEERPEGLPLTDPQVKKARAKLFGAWEMNWLAFNYDHDVKLPNSASKPIIYFMYPQAETADGKKDSLEPESFRYTMTSTELTV
ncbi:MAG TPA: transglutaminase domain-containing protein [Candidatus Binatia bacterium]|jgi:transglutaminase-like putative cysteine protease